MQLEPRKSSFSTLWACGGLDEVHLDGEIVVQEVGGVGVVGEDSSDPAPRPRTRPRAGFAAIQARTARWSRRSSSARSTVRISHASRGQTADDRASDHAAMAGHIDPLAGKRVQSAPCCHRARRAGQRDRPGPSRAPAREPSCDGSSRACRAPWTESPMSRSTSVGRK